MDRAQLITIVVSALIGALAKEIVGWLVSTVKGLTLIPTAYGKFKAFYNGPDGGILANFLNLFFFVGLLIYFARKDGATSNLDVIFISLSTIMILVFLLVLLFQLGMRRERRRKNTAE